MAIIYSYPEKTSPAGGDFLVITDSEQPAPNKNRTKSLTIDNLASYISTSTSGITGSGTLNTIAMFTPNGQAIGDSRITQAALGAGINVNTNLTVKGTSTFNNDATLSNGNALRWTSDDVRIEGTTAGDNIKFYVGHAEILQLAQSGTLATVTGNLRVTGAYYDSSNSPGTTGQVLTSTGSTVEWKSYSESGATFLGWARYDGTPSFSNGSEVTVTDGNFIDPPVSLVTNQIIDPYTNGASGKFVFTNDDLNAVYCLTAVFKASAANANQTHIDVNFISGATDYERLSKSVAFYKGNDTVQNFHEMYQFYVDSDLITYGLQPRLYAEGGTVKFGDVIFFIQKQQQPAM